MKYKNSKHLKKETSFLSISTFESLDFLKLSILKNVYFRKILIIQIKNVLNAIHV